MRQNRIISNAHHRATCCAHTHTHARTHFRRAACHNKATQRQPSVPIGAQLHSNATFQHINQRRLLHVYACVAGLASAQHAIESLAKWSHAKRTAAESQVAD